MGAQRWLGWAGRWSLCLALAAGPALAIDNPDREDPLPGFAAAVAAHEERIARAPDAAAALDASVLYARFLDERLNHAYGAVLRGAGPDARNALRRAQRQWLAYRDAEIRFIQSNWSNRAHGSSAALSRAAFRNGLVRERTRTLLEYLRSYPPD
ncbi:lysozyme inhibitor LprI family protein [Zoogloea sp.]|uniref:lysozyme inhibitor LprI family protein n=1 Tax=Zoogloea sp. TaxID=49181 RepID=UPI002603D8E0|nr:lysozyme inhibitor LprI family protein [Zoogloea sp.]MDD3352144.1 lysozyme inhibitor LprI family protein [Zoogloea sp.]